MYLSTTQPASTQSGSGAYQYSDWSGLFAYAVDQDLTGNDYIDGLLSGWRWNTSSLRFNFPTSTSYYPTTYSKEHEPDQNFHEASTALKDAVRWALTTQFASVANLTFTEVAPNSVASISLAYSDAPDGAWGYPPSAYQRGGDVWFNDDVYSTPVRGARAWLGVMHELGHALGLKHPHDFDIASGWQTHDTVMPSNRDGMEFTLMSYNSYVGGPGYRTYEEGGAAQSLMMYDIAALQEMYGANFTTNSGDTVYSFSPTSGQMFINGVGQGAPGANRILLTIWDGGGRDTYDLSNYSSDLQIDLAPGRWSLLSPDQLSDLDTEHPGTHFANGNVYNALLYHGDTRSLIENANGGSGNDTILGNQANNVLRGNDGADSLSGLSGNDDLYGGAGCDHLYGGAGSDHLYGGDDADELHGGWHNDTLFGGSGNDQLFGEEGQDTLSGGTGSDACWGGAGNDTFVFADGHGMDVIHDFTAGGTEDAIQFTGSAFDSFADVLSAASPMFGGTLIQTGSGSSILLEGVDMSELSPSDFIFGWVVSGTTAVASKEGFDLL